MILDEIVLHDFGIYGGRQSIDLTPTSKGRPVILFGGLNGGGKTTLLDALQLCFFGPVAKCAGRADLSYDEYLRRSVHRRALSPEAAIEVAFRHTVDGRVQHWRLCRSWTAGDSLRERFQVIRNDRVDKAASEQWSSQVEDFIPARIAHLFLFDGEKVEGYADLAQAPGLIRTAIQNLLGLDIVERLSVDLTAIERRKRVAAKPPAEAEEVAALRDEIRGLLSERSRLVRERGAGENDRDRLRRELDELERRYEREGGSLYEDRGRLEAERAVTERGLEAIRKFLREIAAGPAPLALVRDLLDEVAERASAEEHGRRCAETAEVVAEEQALLLNQPTLKGLAAGKRAELEAYAASRLAALRAAGDGPRILNLDDGGRASLEALLTSELVEAQAELQALLSQSRELDESVGHTRTLLGAVPEQATIAELLAKRELVAEALRAAEFERQRLDESLARIDREIENARERETRLLETNARDQFEHEDVGRLLRHTAKVRATLQQFQAAVIERHVARIEGLVLDSFRQLVRKSTLVTGLRIDPATFTLMLRGSDGRELTAERLSAGERQLLAIAMLWGLARASGRPLPTVIDTPLGRLDADHRTRLVTQYFPHASHQVMLLSTDEEITREHYRALEPSIGRSYRLRYDEGQDRTIVEPGYLPNEALN
ncbi:MAG TPA: DNA sulfur modification protein DndD [Allosphingosinicella sp.]|nr:DNA sulfur modification protein DndD [Allosphingosinicella sp.]